MLRRADLRNFTILAETATKITPCAGNGKSGCARKEMIQGFFLHRVDIGGNKFGIIMRIKDAGNILTYSAKTKFTLRNFTAMRTKLTMHPQIFQLCIKLSFFHMNKCVNFSFGR